MTIRIPLGAVAFFVYTLALLGGAFGISYAVFEWRDDDEAFDASNIERSIDELEGQTEAGPTQAELDAQRCEAALTAAGDAVSQGPTSGPGFATFPQVPAEIKAAIDRYCK